MPPLTPPDSTDEDSDCMPFRMPVERTVIRHIGSISKDVHDGFGWLGDLPEDMKELPEPEESFEGAPPMYDTTGEKDLPVVETKPVPHPKPVHFDDRYKNLGNGDSMYGDDY